MLDKDRCIILDVDGTGASMLYLLVHTKACLELTRIGATHPATDLELSSDRKRLYLYDFHSQRMSVWDTTELDLLARGTVIMDH